MAAIHLVKVADPPPLSATHHRCPFPGCPKTLLNSLPACKRHRAWLAAKDAAAGAAEEGGE